MNVWALSDFHLSFGTPNKSMEVFGPHWNQWIDKMSKACHSLIKQEDLLLVPGDISWASSLEQVLPDLLWIHSLPGTKLLLKGNHDYWWPSKTKLEQILPPSVHALHNDAFKWKGIAIAGARLWDTPEYSFSSLVNAQELSVDAKQSEEASKQDNEKIFQRELIRLRMSLDALPKEAERVIVMTHYPPIGLDLKPSRTSLLLDEYPIDYCVFGHLHNLNTRGPLFGKAGTITYLLTSCDYLDFTPLKIL